MKTPKLLLIISIVLVSIGGSLLLAGTVLSFVGLHKLSDIFLGISSLLGVLALATIVIRLTLTVKENPNPQPQVKVVVKTVDVKDIPKTHEEKLYEQYEDLYRRNLITKEELDAKRKELLGK